MEDYNNTVFIKDSPVLYKQILDIVEADELNDELICGENWQDSSKGIATGFRQYRDINLDYNIIKRLVITLSDYYPDIVISRYARFYNQQFGAVRPHKDCDGVNKYTLLLYMTDRFEDGKLSVKLKRSDDELIEYPDKKHKIFTFIPKKGWAVIFNKELTHWAGEVYTGEKNFLLIHFNSLF